MARKPQRIGIVANPEKSGNRDLIQTLIRSFHAAGLAVRLDDNTARHFAEVLPSHLIDGVMPLSKLTGWAQVLAVLGGDGTMLRVMGEALSAQPELRCAVAAINSGTLGFLSCATADEAQEAVNFIVEGNFQISHRAVIEIRVGVKNRRLKTFYALNEVAVTRGAGCRMVSLEVCVGGRFVNHYAGDGLIVATPTGSTAYSLSAGGPIIEPMAPVFAITPICPHALSDRAIVVSDSSLVQILPKDLRDPALIAVDGEQIAEIDDTFRVEIRRAPVVVPLIFRSEASFFGVLRQKLGWAGSTDARKSRTDSKT
ncbi:MAG: NAD(+)/NADH kinase [Verrucomicrobiales bacterium]|nr:NAD(+)/NADH kinase [Verrucomicrobiales bacterium]